MAYRYIEHPYNLRAPLCGANKKNIEQHIARGKCAKLFVCDHCSKRFNSIFDATHFEQTCERSFRKAPRAFR